MHDVAGVGVLRIRLRQELKSHQGDGHRTELTPRTTTYAHNTANQLTQAGATTYGYDANGNQTTSSAARAFAYNSRNQTASITPAGGGAATALKHLGEGQSEFIGDGTNVVQNNLLGVGRLVNGATQISYTRDNQGRLIGMRSAAGSHYYLFEPHRPDRGHLVQHHWARTCVQSSERRGRVGGRSRDSDV